MNNFIKKINQIYLTKIRIILYKIRLFFSSYKQEFVIVTGADSSHYKSLCQLLSSLLKYEPKTKIIIYNLGLIDSETKYLNSNFSIAELRLFDYSQYPDYLNIKINAGEYAWKPIIFNDIMNEFKCCVCWLDAGNKITEPLTNLRKFTEWIGFYSPFSSGTIADWTHFKTLNYLKVEDSILSKKNLNGASISVNYNNRNARNLIKKWAKFALIQECIAPKGSNRSNHRQDQAVLSVLAYQSGFGQKMINEYLGFRIHQDIDETIL